MELLKKVLVISTISLLILMGCNTTKSIIMSSEHPIKENIIEMKGFFCREYKPNVYEIIFLYKNSVLLNIGSCSMCEGKTVNEIVENQLEMLDNLKERKDYWGAFSIRDYRIHLKKYFPIGWGSYSVKESSGIVIDKETIKITHINDEKLEKSRVYQFYPYSPKPDSTNQFIKGLE